MEHLGAGSVQDYSIPTESAPKPGGSLTKAVAGHEQCAINLRSKKNNASCISPSSGRKIQQSLG
jgi:hypothetical protein